ncbi:MAG: RNA methyltransferase [Nitrospirae bacterium]|nr:RNA methyltransferase [Nitrospirota bacterium]
MRYKKITSASNPLIREILRKKKVGGGNALIIEGRHLLEMALSSGSQVGTVFFTGQFMSKNEEFLVRVSAKIQELVETTEQVLARLAGTETPQGLVALVSYKMPGLDELSLGPEPLVVLCDAIQDPGNLGTIVRTSDAAGANAIILLPGTCDVFMPKAVRATAGSIFNLPVLYEEAEALLRWLKTKSVRLSVADVHATASLYEIDLRGPLTFVFGNEAAGVSDYLRTHADVRFRVPIFGKAESLNVAASAAVCLYEAVRQRKGRSRSAC